MCFENQYNIPMDKLPASHKDSQTTAAELIEAQINDSIIDFYNNIDKFNIEESDFEKLISLGELVDRLSIVNFKLYKLKDDVMNSGDELFRSWASVEDVRLVEERSRLKKCIDQKILSMINRVHSGDLCGGFNAEVKKYGDKNE